MAERGQSVLGPSLWPDAGGRPIQLLTVDFERPNGLLYPLAGTMVLDSRRAALSREAWLKHPLILWSLSDSWLGLVPFLRQFSAC